MIRLGEGEESSIGNRFDPRPTVCSYSQTTERGPGLLQDSLLTGLEWPREAQDLHILSQELGIPFP